MQVGLGTGGVYLEDALDVFTDALLLGYRLFDTAREYGNEHILPQALTRAQELLTVQCRLPLEQREYPDACDSVASGAQPVQRRDLFLQSKVWPTELGVAPTTAAVHTSLRLLQTNNIDHYMLHWPTYVILNLLHTITIFPDHSRTFCFTQMRHIHRLDAL